MNPFATLIGQTQAVELLQQAVMQQKIAPAYLFYGTPGIGRSLAARCFSTMLLSQDIDDNNSEQIEKRLLAGNHPDWLRVEPTYLHQKQRLSVSEAKAMGLQRKAPPQIRIEQVREITRILARPPLIAPRSVIVLEDAQTMGEGAANALLKTLEEPGKATLILIAPSLESLLPTLVSRCQRIPFSPLNPQQMQQVLSRVEQAEILQDEVILGISQGSPGKAIECWQHLQTIPQDLMQKLLQPPFSSQQALALAKEIAQNLDSAVQLWLLDYLQYSYWQRFLDGMMEKSVMKPWEEARKALLCYAQPRLVWEVTLLGI